MELARVIDSFNQLGDRLKNNLNSEYYQARFKEAHFYNRWFTPANVQKAVKAIAEEFLDKTKMHRWVADYQLPVKNRKNIGIVMAGNIPLVGFHDLLAVLISGHEAIVKLSSKDEKLLPFLLEELKSIDEELVSRVHIKAKLTGYDAVIATGSNNTARYFDYYFGNHPHIIRKNRSSVAILTGDESEETLRNLASDIFSYFGLGCRNVSKLYAPEGYDFNLLFEVFKEYEDVIDHTKYENNYLYNKSFLVMGDARFMDTGFLMVREKHDIASPIGMLHLDYYADKKELKDDIKTNESEIQCVISSEQIIDEVELRPGEAQKPQLWDYPDKIDTLGFLASLAKVNATI